MDHSVSIDSTSIGQLDISLYTIGPAVLIRYIDITLKTVADQHRPRCG